jgi:hypothetical protein
MDRMTFAQDQAVADERAEVAKELAKMHYQAEAGLQRIFRLTGSVEVEMRPVEPIKLLEVNANTVPSGVMPVQFGPAPASGIPYPSVIVEVSPEEFQRIQMEKLKLPKGWRLGEEMLKLVDDVYPQESATSSVDMADNGSAQLIIAPPSSAQEFAMQQLREHFEYLKRVSTVGNQPPITLKTAESAWNAWIIVWEATGFALPIPAACTGPDGQILYSWDNDQHHFELEIIPEQPAEFFYKNRGTGELWGEDYNIGDSLSNEACQRLKLFI